MQTGARAVSRPGVASTITALLLAAAILLGTTLAANLVRSSNLYSKSRLISMIFSQEQINITDIAGNKRNVDLLLKFVGALTGAYIDFEMIPVNEIGTFAAVFESLPAGIEVEKFEYHRKNLTIAGTAANEDEYQSFLDSLRVTGYFEGVTSHYYLATSGRIQFELECISQAAQVHLEFG